MEQAVSRRDDPLANYAASQAAASILPVYCVAIFRIISHRQKHVKCAKSFRPARRVATECSNRVNTLRQGLEMIVVGFDPERELRDK
jgi:hypothetical protein